MCADTTAANGSVYTHDGVKIIGNVPIKFPVPALPKLADAATVFPTAVFAMFVGFIESIAVAKTYALANGCVQSQRCCSFVCVVPWSASFI